MSPNFSKHSINNHCLKFYYVSCASSSKYFRTLSLSSLLVEEEEEESTSSSSFCSFRFLLCLAVIPVIDLGAAMWLLLLSFWNSPHYHGKAFVHILAERTKLMKGYCHPLQYFSFLLAFDDPSSKLLDKKKMQILVE